MRDLFLTMWGLPGECPPPAGPAGSDRATEPPHGRSGSGPSFLPLLFKRTESRAHAGSKRAEVSTKKKETSSLQNQPAVEGHEASGFRVPGKDLVTQHFAVCSTSCPQASFHFC